MNRALGSLPAVHRVLGVLAIETAAARVGRAAVKTAVREALAEARSRARGGVAVPTLDEVVGRVLVIVAERERPAYAEVINATGVVIHTNLGRAPRTASSLPAYLALELNLADGERGERLGPVNECLRRYFGAEASTVVTNNAAALFLLLAAHAAGREVLVSRGELIEIGGSFRLPEVMAASGARLVEVGTTNRTHAADYERAIGEATAAILVVHRSNFHMGGFVATPELAELVALGRRRGVPVWVDQGSGCHLDLGQYGLRHEQTVQEILAAGVDAVLFSGDKLLGGPQAGIVLGAAHTLAPLRHHPLRRALRPDKGVLVALGEVLDAYLAGRNEAVPLYRLLGADPSTLARRARAIARRLRAAGHPANAAPSRGAVGGGTTPDQTLPSWSVTVPGGATLARRLRTRQPAIVGRIEDDQVVIDLRAVFPEQDRALTAALLAALAS